MRKNDGDDIGTPGTLAINGKTTKGYIGKKDQRDYFAFKLTKKSKIDIEFKSAKKPKDGITGSIVAQISLEKYVRKDVNGGTSVSLTPVALSSLNGDNIRGKFGPGDYIVSVYANAISENTRIKIYDTNYKLSLAVDQFM